MKQNKLKSSIRKFNPQKRRAVAEVISSLLLVVITVAGAVILVTFLDESFVAGSMAITSGTSSSLKTVKLMAFDTRDGEELMNPDYNIDNQDYFLDPIDGHLCRDGDLSFIANSTTVCNGAFNPNQSPANGGTAYVVIQIQNRGLNPLWLSDVYFDNVRHVWDSSTGGVTLDGSINPGTGEVPRDGMFSILPHDITDLTQRIDNQITEGETVNVVVKLDSINPDIPLSKTIRVQLNIGTNVLQEFLIESGGAQ